MEILIASKNKGKIEEIKTYRDSVNGIKWLTYKDFKGFPDVEETGDSFLDNAIIKARSLAEHTGKPALADDSGLIVDALDGMPGVRSSRYAGSDATDKENRIKLLKALVDIKDESKRSARFICSMILWDPKDGLVFKTDGVCEGRISFKEKGSGGFGYDCIFIPSGYDRTMAQLGNSEKNRISHRGIALAYFYDYIVKL
ncbi:MAG: RdgB/HAM1 family non-canonical purine NTP pyrophosphatase [Actinobacteria bacterium]|nr:RdgB/HAM1 family non-canonical purine NTP pyrophosphatase [Actinomycetota bacterium]